MDRYGASPRYHDSDSEYSPRSGLRDAGPIHSGQTPRGHPTHHAPPGRRGADPYGSDDDSDFELRGHHHHHHHHAPAAGARGAGPHRHRASTPDTDDDSFDCGHGGLIRRHEIRRAGPLQSGGPRHPGTYYSDDDDESECEHMRAAANTRGGLGDGPVGGPRRGGLPERRFNLHDIDDELGLSRAHVHGGPGGRRIMATPAPRADHHRGHHGLGPRVSPPPPPPPSSRRGGRAPVDDDSDDEMYSRRRGAFCAGRSGGRF